MPLYCMVPYNHYYYYFIFFKLCRAVYKAEAPYREDFRDPVVILQTRISFAVARYHFLVASLGPRTPKLSHTTSFIAQHSP
jgi:hypothetical protein